ncbi:hypothetical protein BFL43_09305 [Williamsia sp. 1135]|nr:hypothetical protein BFL43_09305 [Williamsia sp. 1135]
MQHEPGIELWTAPHTQLMITHTPAALLAAPWRHCPQTAVVSAASTAGGQRRGWWPAISLSTDVRVAGAIADQLTSALPDAMRLVVPEASVVVAAALHAASMVDWPPITIAHLLDSRSTATFAELLAGSGSEDLALDLAAVAADLTPGRDAVTAAAAKAVLPLVTEQGIISGPGSAGRGPGPFYELRCPTGTDAVCIDASSTLGAVVADRCRYLARTAGLRQETAA